MENLSGHGKFFEVPKEIREWNWGAFWLTWIWGIKNETFISLLIFVPIVNIFIPFYLGAKGNELAWQNRRWEDEEEFFDTQRKWMKMGWVASVFIVLAVVALIYNYTTIKQQDDYIQSEAYTMISESEEAIAFIGEEFEILEYRRGSNIVFFESTYSIIVKSERGKYWAAIRLDDKGVISEILLSHYFLLEGFHEVIITK